MAVDMHVCTHLRSRHRRFFVGLVRLRLLRWLVNLPLSNFSSLCSLTFNLDVRTTMTCNQSLAVSNM
jgi:hypothetical protein